MSILRFVLRVSALATAVVTMWSGYVYAGVLTINFPDDLADKGSLINQNSTAAGFRISPRFHFDDSVNTNSSFIVPGIGWDESSSSNPQYLGPSTIAGCPISVVCTPGLYVDDNGSPFSVLSLEALGSEDYVAQSSKGGAVFIPTRTVLNPPPLHVDFTGPEWRDIQWVVFSGGGSLPFRGFNQLAVFVPAPATFVLLGLGVLILGWRKGVARRTPQHHT